MNTLIYPIVCTESYKEEKWKTMNLVKSSQMNERKIKHQMDLWLYVVKQAKKL